MRQSQSYAGILSAPPASIDVTNANGASINAIRVDNPSQKYYYAQFANAYIPPFQLGWVFRYERPVTRELLTVQTPPNYRLPSGPVSGAQIFVVVEVSDNPDEFGYGAPFGTELGPRSGSAGQAIQEVYIWQTDGPVGIPTPLSVSIDNVTLPLPANIGQWGGVATSLGQKLMASSVPIVIASDQSDVGVNIDKYGGTATTLGAKLSASSIPVVLATDEAALPVTPPTSATATETNVAGSASSVTLLAANASRKGFVIANDSTAILYVRYNSGAASTTSYTYQMAGSTAGGISMLENPPGVNYTGAITGIWASATGNARVTEYT